MAQRITHLTLDQKILGIQAKCFVCIFLLNLHNNDLKVQGLIILTGEMDGAWFEAT